MIALALADLQTLIDERINGIHAAYVYPCEATYIYW